MTRMRWKVADSGFICAHCRAVIPRGAIHMAKVCLYCTIPDPAKRHTDEYSAFMLRYYTELTRAVRARLGYEPDP